MNERTSSRSLARLAVAGAVVAGLSVAAGGTAVAASGNPWDDLAQCESGGNWSSSTGNGYSGGLQFSPSTWRANGGSGSASGASREEQIAVAERVLASQGWNAWPSCSKKVGAKGKASSSSGTSDRSSSSAKSSEKKNSSDVGSKKSAEKKPAAVKSGPRKSGPAKKNVSAGPIYLVNPGDTLSGIAASHGTSVAALAGRNHIADPDVITVGQRLSVR